MSRYAPSMVEVRATAAEIDSLASDVKKAANLAIDTDRQELTMFGIKFRRLQRAMRRMEDFHHALQMDASFRDD